MREQLPAAAKPQQRHRRSQVVVICILSLLALTSLATDADADLFPCPQCWGPCKTIFFYGSFCWPTLYGITGRCACIDTNNVCRLFGDFCEVIRVTP
jgi:hypothetical protein